MNFEINPNKHYLKALFVIESCTSTAHLDVAERCIELYNSRELQFVKFFDKSMIKPIVMHTGHYDHKTAVWILRKKLSNKKL
jgi:hypothetical protein